MEENMENKVMENEESFISLRHIDKIYDNGVQAVFDFNLEIKPHEFIVFVGPSGCGKSTTLRMIAGLEEITHGELYIGGKLSNHTPSKDRDIAMVFQSYALYPHMNVYENMAYGLKIKNVPEEEIKKRVYRAAKILKLGQYLDRKPGQLSGGQCQRVALGRAIERNAKAFLMDEPLSNLDAKLRVQMRSELSKLHERLNATTIYVTHDQIEAMTMATRIVVMKDGHIQQIGTPEEIYHNPSNLFVATFIGSPAMNIIRCTYEKGIIKLPNGVDIPLKKAYVNAHDKFYKDQAAGESHEICFGIRPESILNEESSHSFKGKVVVSELLGHEYYVHIALNDQIIIAKLPSSKQIRVGDEIDVSFNLDKVHLFDVNSTNRII